MCRTRSNTCWTMKAWIQKMITVSTVTCATLLKYKPSPSTLLYCPFPYRVGVGVGVGVVGDCVGVGAGASSVVVCACVCACAGKGGGDMLTVQILLALHRHQPTKHRTPSAGQRQRPGKWPPSTALYSSRQTTRLPSLLRLHLVQSLLPLTVVTLASKNTSLASSMGEPLQPLLCLQPLQPLMHLLAYAACAASATSAASSCVFLPTFLPAHRIPLTPCTSHATRTHAHRHRRPCGTQLDHDITIVGYTPTTFIIKNSWGTTWGEAGFGEIKRGVAPNGTCGIAMDATYAIKAKGKPAPVPPPTPG